MTPLVSTKPDRNRRCLALDRRAAAAVEFAIVALPCFGLILGLIGVSYDFFLQEALDYSLQEAVRQVQLGQLPPGESPADFTAKVFCPIFISFAACSDVMITVQPVSDFQSATVVTQSAVAASTQSQLFCVGQPGELMFARAIYLAPLLSAIWPYGTKVGVGGTTGNALVAAAAFANENPTGAPIPAGAGC